jgi:hypothetical protein
MCELGSDHDVGRCAGRFYQTTRKALTYLKLGEEKVGRGRSQLTRNRETVEVRGSRKQSNPHVRFTDLPGLGSINPTPFSEIYSVLRKKALLRQRGLPGTEIHFHYFPIVSVK